MDTQSITQNDCDVAHTARISRTAAFVGSRYADRRILILGESNWGVGDMTDADYIQHWLYHPNFLKRAHCALCVRLGRARHPGEKDYERDAQNDALTTMMLGWPRRVTDDARRDAWSQIAFANFITHPGETRSEADRPTDENWHQSAREFPITLALLRPRPRVCLVLDSPSGRLSSVAGPLLSTAGVRVVRLAHPTMRPAPKRSVRAEKWAEVLVQSTQEMSAGGGDLTENLTRDHANLA